jgi:hypothetical protein
MQPGDALLPAPKDIHERLSRLVREKRRLQKLLELVIEAKEDAARPEAPPELVEQGVAS